MYSALSNREEKLLLGALKSLEILVSCPKLLETLFVLNMETDQAFPEAILYELICCGEWRDEREVLILVLIFTVRIIIRCQ